MSMISCPHCGKPISDKANKCVHCGQIVSQTIHCPECNAEVEPNSLECPFCGFPINNDPPQKDETTMDRDSIKPATVRKSMNKGIIVAIAIAAVLIVVGILVLTIKPPAPTLNDDEQMVLKNAVALKETMSNPSSFRLEDNAYILKVESAESDEIAFVYTVLEYSSDTNQSSKRAIFIDDKYLLDYEDYDTLLPEIQKDIAEHMYDDGFYDTEGFKHESAQITAMVILEQYEKDLSNGNAEKYEKIEIDADRIRKNMV